MSRSEVDDRMVNYQVVTNFIHSVVAILVLLSVLFVISWIFLMYRPARPLFVILETMIIISLGIGLFSETIVRTIYQARPPNPKEHAAFIEASCRLNRSLGMRYAPRLYILNMGVPNACAFGFGFFGQYAVGITQELYDLLTPEELEAVVAHEYGHIRSCDIFVASILSIIAGSAEKMVKSLLGGHTVLGSTPIAQTLGFILKGLSKLLEVVRGIFSQIREYVADALAAKYTGTGRHLVTALQKLEGARPPRDKHEPTILDGLVISHPGTEDRIRALNALHRNQ